MFFVPSKSMSRVKNQSISLSRTSDPIKIKIKMPNPSQEPPVSSKAPHLDLTDKDFLCTFKIKMESQIWNMGVSKNSDHIKITIKIVNPSQDNHDWSLLNEVWHLDQDFDMVTGL